MSGVKFTLELGTGLILISAFIYSIKRCRNEVSQVPREVARKEGTREVQQVRLPGETAVVTPKVYFSVP